MNSRRIVLEEAQQGLSLLIDALRREGGRIDVVIEGEAVVSLVRTSDLEDKLSVSVVDEPPAAKGVDSSAAARPLLQRARKRKPRRIV